MMTIEDTYRNLTGIDIQAQERLWDERGKGYYGEYLVFKKIFPCLPGNCKILMNLQIPTINKKTTEIDLLLIHETGLYVFEMKHYKGTIYGSIDQPIWTQYFRTVSNNTFRNPVLQNQYHIRALEAMFPALPLHSFIVFTSSECTLRINGTDPQIAICRLCDFYSQLDFRINSSKSVLTTEEINGIFIKLQPFSPVTTHSVKIDSEEIPFYKYCEQLKQHCFSVAEQARTEKEEAIKHYLNKAQQAEHEKVATIELERQNRKRRNILAACICVAACAVAFLVCKGYQVVCDTRIAAIENTCSDKIALAEKELSAFAQKFEHIEAFNGGDLNISANLITANNIVLKSSSDIENTVLFSCDLKWNGSDYGISIGKDTTIIMILNDGSVKECNVYNDEYPYSTDFYLGPDVGVWYYSEDEASILPHEFYNISVSDISYIKLSDVNVWTVAENQRKTVITGYEIELYDSQH